MSKDLTSDTFATISEFNGKEKQAKEIKLSSSLSNLRQEFNKRTEYVNHPNCVPENQPNSLIGQSEAHDIHNSSLIGHPQLCDTKLKSCDSGSAVKGKPPSGSTGNLPESSGARNRTFLYR